MHIRILTCQHTVIDQNWNFADMLCTHWRLYINGSDGAFLSSNGTKTELKQNRLYLIPAWQTVSMQSTATIKHFYAHFDLIGLTAFLCRKLFPAPMELGEDDFSRFERLLNGAEEDNFTRLCVQSQLKSIIYELLFRYLQQTPQSQKNKLANIIPAANKYSKTIEYIDNNLADRLTNYQLARLNATSEGQFIRNFKLTMGISPAKYITERRITQATEMLIFTDNSIEQIAEKTGFSDRFHFSKVFRKITSLTPGAYRKQAVGS